MTVDRLSTHRTRLFFLPSQFFHWLIVRKVLHGAENPLVVHPPLEVAGDGRRGRALVHHHIGVKTHPPQGVHPVEVLLVGAVPIRQHIDPLAPEVPDLGQLRKSLKKAGQVGVGVVPCEMNGLCPYLIQERHIVRRDEPDVQPLGEVHIGTAGGKLFQQPLMVTAGQQVGVHQLDLFLPTPKLGEVGHMDALRPLLAGHDTEPASVRASPCEEAIGGIGELRVQAVVRAGMLHGIRQVRPRPVAGATADQPVGIGDGDRVLGVGVGEHPALICQVIPPLRPPPLYGIALGFVVGGQFHQAQVRPPVAVHVYKADLQNPTSSQGKRKASARSGRRFPLVSQNFIGRAVLALEPL